MRISVIAPVKNEADFIGYSVMAVLPYVHEIIYACAPSTDGTDALLEYCKSRYAVDKLKILRRPEYDFDPHDMPAYNAAFNDCIAEATGDACWFLHPDMIVTNPEKIREMDSGPLAWWTNMTSYAGDFNTQITRGRATRWKNIHLKTLGLHYYGAYGSQNEDMYHTHVTGAAHEHYGTEFARYPFAVGDSGLNVNHYCELKSYKRRLEKMKTCLKTLVPNANEAAIHEMAMNHPRVTLEAPVDAFGHFEFTKTAAPVPAVFEKHKQEFDQILGRIPACSII